MIQRNETLSGIFPDPPFIAYRKDQNIREKLIRAKLNQSPTDSTSQQLNHTSHDSGFIDDPDDTLDILVSSTRGTIHQWSGIHSHEFTTFTLNLGKHNQTFLS